MPGKRVAVIGAGASGLPALKECLEAGLDATCFERTGHIGGLWRFREDITDGQGSIMKSTIINTSKEMMCYSDFPIPASFPNFMHNRKVNEYLAMYAENFKLLKHIKLNMNVVHIKRELQPTADGKDKATGRWCLQLENLQTGEKWTDIFDCVMLCSGHHAKRNMPDFPGLSDFKGTVMHTHEYRQPALFVNKNVVIVGVGNSALDMAVEISRSAKQVWVSTRRGTWVFHRIIDNGIPLDMVTNQRWFYDLQRRLPASVRDYLAEKILNRRFDHGLYSLKPKHGVMAAHPTVNDDLPNRIACGGIIIRDDIQKVMPTSVLFKDGSTADDVDAIVLGTGYQFGFPFLEKGIIDVKNNEVSLYHLVFPPTVEHDTIAVIGCFQPIGAIFPLAESQCRWVAQVFKGDRTLPSREQMQDEIRERRDEMRQRYVTSQRHTIQVDYIAYMDQLADNIGCRPQLGKLLLTDPALAIKCIFGPASPIQWRLHGPGAWSGAKKAIQEIWSRMEYPLKTRQVPVTSGTHSTFLFYFAIMLVILCVWYMFL